MTQLNQLLQRKQTIEEKLLQERARLFSIAESVGWYAGKTTDRPLFKFEKKLLEEGKEIDEQIALLTT